MRKRARFLLVIAVAAGGGLTAGCGDDGAKTDTAAATTSADGDTTSAADALSPEVETFLSTCVDEVKGGSKQLVTDACRAIGDALGQCLDTASDSATEEQCQTSAKSALSELAKVPTP